MFLDSNSNMQTNDVFFIYLPNNNDFKLCDKLERSIILSNANSHKKRHKSAGTCRVSKREHSLSWRICYYYKSNPLQAKMNFRRAYLNNCTF